MQNKRYPHSLHQASWSPSSWKSHAIKQAPLYEDHDELVSVKDELLSYPPLVFAKEVDLLKNKLKKVQERNAFILQGGDCAESFSRFSGSAIRDFYKLILQMSVILGFSSGKEILKIGRIAGQFAKPRSEDYEERDGVKLPSFRGDIINSYTFSLDARKHSPSRMIRAYQQSASTLNLLRAFSKGGMADLHLISGYNLDFVRNNPWGKRYGSLADAISQAVQFIQSCGVSVESTPHLCEFFVSHEALLLDYEEALCRTDSLSGKIYDCSSHFLWIGERTLTSAAHLEFMRGLQNPKGIKVSPRTDPHTLLDAIDLLNPKNEAGEIVLIIRMGADHIQNALPPIIRAIQKKDKKVIWMSDPMHGNTVLNQGIKTRHFSKIMEEITLFFSLSQEHRIYPGGLHLEMTEENVTECLGSGITQEILQKNYLSECDPRLNASQSLELAFLVAQILKERE